jgi:hypothetical protein
MDDASKYWKLVRIDAAGNRKIQEIPAAISFFRQVFGDLMENDDVSDEEIQRQLLHLFWNASGKKSLFAERCLLCFISWILEQGCLKLERKFGENHNFSCSDLLPYVLDDNGQLSTDRSYECFSRQILRTFDLQKGSLTTWVMMKLKQHSHLNKFLLEECGVYLISDWAILNDTKAKQLERILKEFYNLSEAEIKEAQCLLEGYHNVYRFQRLQQIRKGARGICIPPTTQQLQSIAQYIKSNIGRLFDDIAVSTKLKKLASQLREYRIYVRGGRLPADSIDAVNEFGYNSLVENIPAPQTNNLLEESDNQAEFLQYYRDKLQICLLSALAKVTESRVRQLQSKSGDKAQMFLTALELFQCQNLAMKKIAEVLGLRAQDAVTKLLKLKEFRADVRQEMLVLLRDSVTEIAKIYADVRALKKLDTQLDVVLSEEISKIIENTKFQSRTTNSHLKNEIFTERLCEYLDTRKNYQ